MPFTTATYPAELSKDGHRHSLKADLQGAQRLSQPAHVASQAQLLPPFTQPPFPETQQTAGISSPHASAPGMNPLHWQLAASEGSKGHLTSAERPTGRVHATKQHINPSQVSMDRQSPSPQQQAASQAEAAFRRLAQNPRSPTRASGAGQNAAQPVPSSQAEHSQPAAVAGQGFRMVNGLPSYLWGEGIYGTLSYAVHMCAWSQCIMCWTAVSLIACTTC